MLKEELPPAVAALTALRNREIAESDSPSAQNAAKPAQIPAKLCGPGRKIALTAYQWMTSGHWNPSTRSWIGSSRWNPYNHSFDWDRCDLAFVAQVALSANGHSDPSLARALPAPHQSLDQFSSDESSALYGAWAAYLRLVTLGRAERLSDDRTEHALIPAGAAVFWPPNASVGPLGHVAIHSGQTAPDGDPLIITTGRSDKPGTTILALSTLSAELGCLPSGWAALWSTETSPNA